jgi:hypothetical protein
VRLVTSMQDRGVTLQYDVHDCTCQISFQFVIFVPARFNINNVK